MPGQELMEDKGCRVDLELVEGDLDFLVDQEDRDIDIALRWIRFYGYGWHRKELEESMIETIVWDTVWYGGSRC